MAPRLPLLRLLLAAFLLLAAGSARAAGDDLAKARALYRSASAYYNLGEYRKAIDDYKAAYLIRQDPAFLFNIAQCYRQLGERQAAAREYRAYLREMPKAPQRAQLEAYIAEVDRGTEADLQAASKPPMAPKLPAGGEPSSGPGGEKAPAVEPGGGEKTPTVEPGATPVEKPAPAAEKPGAPVEKVVDHPGPRRWYRDPLALGLLGAGVVALGVGAGLVGYGVSLRGGTAATEGERIDQLDSGGRLAVGGYVAMGVGVLALAGGVVRAVMLGRTRVGVDVGVTGGRTMLLVGGSW